MLTVPLFSPSCQIGRTGLFCSAFGMPLHWKIWESLTLTFTDTRSSQAETLQNSSRTVCIHLSVKPWCSSLPPTYTLKWSTSRSLWNSSRDTSSSDWSPEPPEPWLNAHWRQWSSCVMRLPVATAAFPPCMTNRGGHASGLCFHPNTSCTFSEVLASTQMRSWHSLNGQRSISHTLSRTGLCIWTPQKTASFQGAYQHGRRQHLASDGNAAPLSSHSWLTSVRSLLRPQNSACVGWPVPDRP